MSKPEETATENDYDPTLDISSEQFDPLKALYADNVRLPYENAKMFDNVSRFESYLNAAGSTAKKDGTQPPPAADPPVFQRRFLPHQSNPKKNINLPSKWII